MPEGIGSQGYELGGRRYPYLGPPEATKPVILRSRINPSERKTRQISRKYYRPFWPRALTGAAFRAMTGRTVNPQVPGSSPGRGANIQWVRPVRALDLGNILGNIF